MPCIDMLERLKVHRAYYNYLLSGVLQADRLYKEITRQF